MCACPGRTLLQALNKCNSASTPAPILGSVIQSVPSTGLPGVLHELGDMSGQIAIDESSTMNSDFSLVPMEAIGTSGVKYQLPSFTAVSTIESFYTSAPSHNTTQKSSEYLKKTRWTLSRRRTSRTSRSTGYSKEIVVVTVVGNGVDVVAVPAGLAVRLRVVLVT